MNHTTTRWPLVAGLVFVLLAVCAAPAFSQNWKRGALTDKWGDSSGWVYAQMTTGTGHGRSGDVAMTMVYGWSSEAGTGNRAASVAAAGILVISCSTVGDFIYNPASSLLDENITLSTRRNGVTREYSGFTETKSWTSVFMTVVAPEFIEQLHGAGQWDVLIEGRNWYIRSTIKGGLPKE